jgi:hypothetical protein
LRRPEFPRESTLIEGEGRAARRERQEESLDANEDITRIEDRRIAVLEG